MGEWYAFVACLFVCITWLWVFDWHFKARMPQHQQRRENERADKKRERSPVSTCDGVLRAIEGV